MTKPSNETLAVMIKRVEDLMVEKFESNNKYHEAHGKRLDTLNGQVKKNTTWRHRGFGTVAVMSAIIPAIISYFLGKQ